MKQIVYELCNNSNELRTSNASPSRHFWEVIERIKARLPQGTVKKRQDNDRAYIPNQVYTDRVEQAPNSRWDRESLI